MNISNLCILHKKILKSLHYFICYIILFVFDNIVSSFPFPSSLIRANNHLMAEIEESKTQHSAEVHQLQWNYEQLRQTMAALECISENPPTETGSLLSLAAETMSKPSVKLYDSDEKESLTFH